MEHSLCNMIKAALKRSLGIRGMKKLPLLHEQLSATFTRQLGNSHTLHTVVTCFSIALMYEGCLRWHDLSHINFGDILITKEFICIFVQTAKTDAYLQGQWVTLATSTRLLAGERTPTKEPHLSLTEIPISFEVNKRSQLPDFYSRTQNQHFLNTLKDWGDLEWVASDDIGTHSLPSIRLDDYRYPRPTQTSTRAMEERERRGWVSINIQMQVRACHYAAKAKPSANLSPWLFQTSIIQAQHTYGGQTMRRTSKRTIMKKVHLTNKLTLQHTHDKDVDVSPNAGPARNRAGEWTWFFNKK